MIPRGKGFTARIAAALEAAAIITPGDDLELKQMRREAQIEPRYRNGQYAGAAFLGETTTIHLEDRDPETGDMVCLEATVTRTFAKPREPK